MAKEPIIFKRSNHTAARAGSRLESIPAIIRAQGERAGCRFIEFFTATIRNRNTRMAYARAVKRFFDWCAPPRAGGHRAHRHRCICGRAGVRHC